MAWRGAGQDCPRHQRRGRQKRNEQIRKQFDAQERSLGSNTAGGKGIEG